MYKKNKIEKTTISINDSYIGETIEKKVRRITNQNEPITDGAEVIYTERKDGVKAEFNVRTDRFELAVDATDYISRSQIAKRENKMEAIKGGAENAQSVGGTSAEAAE